MLCTISLDHKLGPVGTLSAVDYMDDGTPIAVKITIDRNERTAVFDFTGTGPEVYGESLHPIIRVYL